MEAWSKSDVKRVFLEQESFVPDTPKPRTSGRNNNPQPGASGRNNNPQPGASGRDMDMDEELSLSLQVKICLNILFYILNVFLSIVIKNLTMYLYI